MTYMEIFTHKVIWNQTKECQVVSLQLISLKVSPLKKKASHIPLHNHLALSAYALH